MYIQRALSLVEQASYALPANYGNFAKKILWTVDSGIIFIVFMNWIVCLFVCLFFNLNYVWTYLRHFFDIKYVFNRFAPVVVDVVTFAWLDYQPIFGKWTRAPYLKREKRKTNLMLFSTSFSCCLCCCCLFVCFFISFFFPQCRKLSINLSKEQRVPVHQSFSRKYNMHFYQLAVEWTWYNTIFICTHSCSKINYNNENIKSKN